ncbi:MAG TPA: hypothetical protein VFL66_12595 [Gaiellaceae bacterium]|nr:hypothetical protein [Gaiellaceae bacterium]
MGWRERDYARFDDEERRILYGGAAGSAARAPVPARVTTRTAARGAGAAIALSFALFAAGRFPPGHPLVPALHFRIPAANRATPPRQLALALPALGTVGSGITIDGTASGFEGQSVTLEASIDGGAWRIVDAARIADDGSFRVQARYTTPGVLALRLRYPNGDEARGTVTVRS